MRPIGRQMTTSRGSSNGRDLLLTQNTSAHVDVFWHEQTNQPSFFVHPHSGIADAIVGPLWPRTFYPLLARVGRGLKNIDLKGNREFEGNTRQYETKESTKQSKIEEQQRGLPTRRRREGSVGRKGRRRRPTLPFPMCSSSVTPQSTLPLDFEVIITAPPSHLFGHSIWSREHCDRSVRWLICWW